MAAAVPFALAPGLVTAGILNFNTEAGRKLYASATKSVYANPDEQFDGSAEKLGNFLHHISIRAQEFGWGDNGILDIDINVGGLNPNLVNLLTHYGEITVDQVLTHVNAYIGTESRATQDSTMLYHALTKSIDASTMDKVRNKSNEYKVNGRSSGELFLRIIIREVHTDTPATLTNIYRQITDLPNYMKLVSNDITKFNQHVEELEAQLRARGATSTELLTTLFYSYSTVQDEVFTRYIEQRENQYGDGQLITVPQLMNDALTKYRTRVDAKLWEAPTKEQEEITALKTQLVQLKKQQKKTKKSKSNNSDAKNENKAEKKDKKEKHKKPEWMKKKPTKEEIAAGNKKTVDDKEYYWCPHHNAWGRHHPSECKGVGLKPEELKELKAKEVVIAPGNGDDEDEE